MAATETETQPGRDARYRGKGKKFSVRTTDDAYEKGTVIATELSLRDGKPRTMSDAVEYALHETYKLVERRRADRKRDR